MPGRPRPAARRARAGVTVTGTNSPGSPARAPYSAPVSGSTAEPTAFTTTSAATTAPPSSTALAVPIPPLSPPTRAPVPAPTTPCSTGPACAASNAAAPGDGVRAGHEITAAAQVEHHRGGHDRHHPAGHREADPGRLQPGHHPVRRGQAVRAAAAEHHGVHPLHGVARVQQVGLPGAGRRPAHVRRRRPRPPAGRAPRWSRSTRRGRTPRRGRPEGRGHRSKRCAGRRACRSSCRPNPASRPVRRSGRLVRMTQALLPRERRVLAPGAVHVPDWLDLDQQRDAGPGLPAVGRRGAGDPGRDAAERRPDVGAQRLPGLALVPVPLLAHPRRPGRLAGRAVPGVAGRAGPGGAGRGLPRPGPGPRLPPGHRADQLLRRRTPGWACTRTSDEVSREPVVSLSIGAPCLFRLGNTEHRGRPWTDVPLRSGDLRGVRRREPARLPRGAEAAARRRRCRTPGWPPAG